MNHLKFLIDTGFAHIGILGDESVAGMEGAYQILNKPFTLCATGETTHFYNLGQKTESG